MFQGTPSASQIMCNSKTTTGTLITVPAGFWYTGSLTVGASVSVAGTSVPTVTVAGTGVAPAAGTIIGKVTVNGLALTTVVDSMTTEIIVLAPVENDVTIDFNQGASGTSYAVVNGFIF